MSKRLIFNSFSIIALTVISILSLVSCMMSAGDSDLGAGYYPGAGEVFAEGDSESYTEIVENPFVSTSDNNTSYFSIDANTTSYPNLRSLIADKRSIPKDAVRVEEMLNYFDYDYKSPDGEILALSASMFDSPYNPDAKLLTIGLAAEEVELSGIKNNLVFLIDVSGSMDYSNKLPLVQAAFMMMVENLGPEDRISIVTYAGAEKVALSGAYGHEKAKIMAVIEDLYASGSTNGSKAIDKAYELASQYYIEGGNNRVILATDGDFNVGIQSTDALGDFIAEKRDRGIYFSVYGFGRGNVKSDKMETLALKGNGVASYIDSVKEAKRALVEDIGGSIVTVAKDVKAGITFNTNYIESFRLVGYENKLLTEEEFENSATDAGELGSGHTVTVVYEVKLKSTEIDENSSFADVIIKYKPTENVGGNAEEEKSLTLTVGAEVYHEAPTAGDLFVASVVEFALILRDSEYKANSDLDALIERLDTLDFANDEFKAEFRDVVKAYRANIAR